MVTTTKTKEWYLRYPLEDPMHKTALCEIKDEKDFLPENSSVFQPVTARVAAALSMSAADETLLKENLRALGFGDIVTLAYGEGDRDKIGMCIASRVKGEQLQIAVVLRGTCGEEWYSNFEIGYSAEHSCFARAADFAELRLADGRMNHNNGWFVLSSPMPSDGKLRWIITPHAVAVTLDSRRIGKPFF